jgi:hypothetical protein
VDPTLAASKVDPFFDLPVENDKIEMHRLFFDCTTEPPVPLFTHVFPDLSLLDFTIECARSINVPRPPEIASELIQSPFFVPAMNDPALCLSVLACAAAAIPNRLGQSARNVTALTLVGMAMQALRERMNSDPENITDSTIVAATFLWAVNSLLEDPTAMKAHAASVYSLVHARGGLGRLGMTGAAAIFISWVDILHGIISVEPCHFQEIVAPGPFTRPPAQIYGAFFETERAAMLLDHRLIEVCRNSCRDSEILEKAVESGISAAEYVHLISRLRYSLIQRTSLHAEFDNSGSANECVIIALEFIHMMTFHEAQDQKMLLKDKTRRFVRALRRTGGSTFWATDVEVLIWILFVIVLVPYEFDSRDWCMDLLVRTLVAQFGDDDWPQDWQEQVREDYLQPLVWSNTRCAEPFEKICQSLRQRTVLEEDDD